MGDHDIDINTIVDAKKETITADEAMELVLKANKVLAAKGKKVLEFTLKAGQLQDEATMEDLRKAIIGPSGNLRAPTLFCGKTWVVGFNPEMYEYAHLNQ